MGEVAVESPFTYVDDPAFRRVETHSRSGSFSSRSKECLNPSAVVRKVAEDRAVREETENAFFVADMGAVIRQHRKWNKLLPRVEPFYAIKCNTDPQLLQTLLPLCSGFDCASKGEIETMLKLGVPPSHIIYANPCKPPSHIRYAREHGVHLMTFDNADELHKVKSINPNAQMVLRILTDDSKSVCRFGTKFGAHLHLTYGLLETAKKLGLQVVGVSFHVGSGCQDPLAFDDAVRRARKVFDEGASLGFRFHLLDVGGGFPGSERRNFLADERDIHGKCGTGAVTFESIAGILGPSIDKHFPDPSIHVIAEPGRFYAAPAFTLATSITSRRVVVSAPLTKPADTRPAVIVSGAGEPETEMEDCNPASSYMYYVTDGAYGSFNCLLYDHAQAFPKVLVTARGRSRSDESPVVDDDAAPVPEEDDGLTLYDSSVWGPTCDSMDCLTKNARLPELAIGDWLYFDEMGAYTLAAASRFNGFELADVVYVNTETGYIG